MQGEHLDFEPTAGDEEERARNKGDAASGSARWRLAQEEARLLWLVWRERRYARAAARAAVQDFRRFHGSHADLHGRELYVAWIAGRLGSPFSEAQRIIRQASASFAEWPNDRKLSLRHILQYLVVTQYLAKYPGHAGTSANMIVEIARQVPPEM